MSVAIHTPAAARTLVRVLGYPFPPFIDDNKTTGLTPDILKLLNEAQDKFIFKLSIANPKERYAQILSGKQDMILFETPLWGWQDKQDNVVFSKLLLKGGEVYITKRGSKSLPKELIDMKHLRIVGFEGYHYKFADYQSDKEWLSKNFDITFTHSHQEILETIKSGERDVGVVPVSYLKQHFQKFPEEISVFSVSPEFAQVYHLHALLRQNGPINVTEFDNLLRLIKNSQALQTLLEKDGILRQWAF
ncbi:MAG: ABC transporter substrate-binding protein [Methylocystaceae bacterium]|nr:ABC transporter substrate-binding protein [Methylocystaceae bacterium]